MKSHWLIQAVVLAAFLFNTASASADSQVEKAFELGVPQKRQRQLFIGTRLDIPQYFPGELKPAPCAT